MARPYSKKTVDQAEEICLVFIRRDFDTDNVGYGLEGYARELGIEGYTTAARLARAAWDAVRRALPNETASEAAVEAAALIRSGWMIGDPVEILESMTVPNVSIDKPIDVAAEADAYWNRPPVPHPVLIEANVELSKISTDNNRILEASDKDYTHEDGAIIDDGPHEPATVFEDDLKRDAEEIYGNGDYGADS